MDWEDCKRKNLAKKSIPDKNIIDSLILSSKRKKETNQRINLDKITSSTKISIGYESLREILEAIAIKNGFKIYNHDCFSGFLKEICKANSSSLKFDGFRRMRNKVNYYGEEISLEDAKIILLEMEKLRELLIQTHL